MDTLMTMLGQPAPYWNQPSAADEYNDFFAWFLTQGAGFFLWTSLLYIVGAVLVASLLPRRFALVAVFAYVLGHYTGATSWMINRFDFGMWLPVCYAVVIGFCLVGLGSDVRTENLDSSSCEPVPLAGKERATPAWMRT
jgi:hypothetical protein